MNLKDASSLSPSGPQTVLITGTRKGLGKALSESFLAAGWCVHGCSRGEGSIDHPNYQHWSCDVSDEKAVISLFRDLRKVSPRLDAMIANAGIAAMNHSLLTPGSSVRAVFETNVYGSFFCLREAAKWMQKFKTGRILLFSSIAAPMNLEGEAIYAASKAAVESLTRTTARELASTGITVNAIGPSPIETDLIKTIPKEKLQTLLQRMPLARFGTPEEVCHLAHFFLAPKSHGITGQVLYLGGVSG